MRVLTIFGTRPEAVKLAPVVRRLQETEGLDSIVCVTAQHREMLDQVVELFDLEKDYDLDLMRADQSLSELTAAVFQGLEPVLAEVQPDWVLVQGDTTTVMAAALLAYYHRVRIGHVEAGLRTGDKWQPYPEEVNRRVAGVVADLHFAPTEWARENLLREGVPEELVHVTGNPVIDALRAIADKPFSFDEWGLTEPAPDKDLVLVTAHRRESFGQPLESVFRALRELAEMFEERAVIMYPVHLNPNVQEPARRMLGDVENVQLLAPLPYLPFLQLMRRARLILTDSGGIQEEAPAFGVPVLVLRDKTERPEALEAGTARLVGTDPRRIVFEAERLLEDDEAHRAMAAADNPFGDGRAAERIVDLLLES